MRAARTLRLAWRAVRSDSVRSVLTVLSVAISVATVVALVALSASLQVGLAGDIAGDASTVNVWAGPADGPENPGSGRQAVFTDRDVNRIESLESVERVGVRGSARVGAITIGNSTVRRQRVVAVQSAYFSSDEFQSGRPFEDGARQVVLNPAAVERFESNVSVGDTVKLKRPNGTERATVVGTLEDSNAQDPFDGLGEKPRVYVPVDPYYDRTVAGENGRSRQAYPVLFVVATDATSADAVSKRTRAYLHEESDAVAGLPDGYEFSLRTNEQFLDLLLDLLQTVARFTLAVAGISLAVGGISIANAMFISVIERTREIGTMKAVGAQRRDVLLIFLTESVLLSTLGSVLGILVGVGAGLVGTVAINLPFVVPWRWIAVALGVGIGVGSLAGLYPAWKAATVDPITALQAE